MLVFVLVFGYSVMLQSVYFACDCFRDSIDAGLIPGRAFVVAFLTVSEGTGVCFSCAFVILNKEGSQRNSH